MNEDPVAHGKARAVASAWSPFRHIPFRVLWTATLVSNIGTWMNDVGASWLMTSLAPSPLMVALVQTATTLPIFLFALPAGALADIVDRRQLLIRVQFFLMTAAAGFVYLVWRGWVTAPLLLMFTFLLGTGAAFIGPAWQAIVPRLVPQADLQSAIALNSVGINISRAIGPAIAGLVIVGAGIAAPFALNALSFLGVIAALFWWRPPPAMPSTLPAERLWGATVAGLRYARSSRPLKQTLVRATAFFLFASAYWALLPLIVRQELGGGAELYGLLLAAVGFGAVLGAFFLPSVKLAIGPNSLVTAGTVGTALVMLVVVVARQSRFAFAGPLIGVNWDSALSSLNLFGSLIFGASWIAVLATLNVSAQIALPEWVRARGLSIFLTVFFGSMSLGSALWGQIAAATTISTALFAAAVGSIIAIPVTWRARLNQAPGLDLTPSMHWPEPVVARDVPQDRGPVMVIVEYRVREDDCQAFVAAVTELSHARRRDGAFAWGLVEDVAQPGRFLEYFMEPSWLEHLRHHERVTEADRLLQEKVRIFHRGEEPPRVTHYLAPGPWLTVRG